MVPIILLFGQSYFTAADPAITNPVLSLLLIALIPVALILTVWQIVHTVQCVAEVQRFSSWRSLGSLLLAGLILLIPAIIIGVLVGGLSLIS